MLSVERLRTIYLSGNPFPCPSCNEALEGIWEPGDKCPRCGEDVSRTVTSFLETPGHWFGNTICPNCLSPADPKIAACETGFNYCSGECAKEHVEAHRPEGGY